MEVKIIVGNTDSDVKTLNEALEMAQPGTTIKLNEGHYHVWAKIKTPGLKIEPRKKDTPVYLLWEEGACITVDLKQGETCIINSIIIAHFGSNIANKFNEQIKDTNLSGANPKFLKQFDCNKDMDWAVLVLGGNLIMRNCLVSLKSLPENIKSSISSFVAMPGSRVNLIKTEIRGNESINTAGAIMLNSDVLISDCIFNNFRAGGLFVSGHSETSIKISDTTFNRWGVAAIYSQGEDWKPLFLRVKIENVDGPGIKVYKANRAKIKGWDISKCQMGIEVIWGDPFIILNKIYKNYEHGILTVAKKGLRWDALIKFNEIYKNKDNGIVWSGESKKSYYNRIILYFENYTIVERFQI